MSMIEPNIGMAWIEQALRYMIQEYGFEETRRKVMNKPQLWGLLLQLVGDETAPDVPAPSNPDLAPFSTRGNEILLNGKPFKFVGCNMRELAWYNTPAMPYATDAHFFEQLDTAKAIGFQVVRFYAFHVDYPVEIAIDLTKRVLNALQARGMYAIVVLHDGVGDRGVFRVKENNPLNWKDGLTHRWYGGGYNDDYLPAVRKLVGAIGNHPALFAWSPGNEFRTPFPPAPTLTQCQNMLEAFDVISTTIRSLSDKIMIIPGLEHSYNLFVGNAYGGQQFSRKLYSLPNIDLVSIHSYHDEAGNLYGGAYERVPHELAIDGIPKIIEETGLISSPAHLYPVFLQNLVSVTETAVSGWMQWGFSAPRTDINAGGGGGMVRTCDHGGACYQWDGLVKFWSDLARRFAV